MTYVKYQKDGQTYDGLYYWKQNMREDTKGAKILEKLDFAAHGSTYKERKNSLRETAVAWSWMAGEAVLSFGEAAHIGMWFRNNGKRYGLLAEFAANGIC